MEISIWFWVGFIAFILFLLALDLGVLRRKSHIVKFKEAVIWSAIWISLALLFCAGVYHYLGAQKAKEFLAGYLIEYSLSLDNIFVFVMIFSYFKVPEKYIHRVLFWGIIGALVMRGIIITSGVAVINQFHWIIYIFGFILIFTGIKMLISKMEGIDPDNNPIIKTFKKFFAVTKDYRGKNFFVRERGKLYATPLFIVILMIESSDLVFAIDSIPAIFAITNDPFILYTSNIFAILGLRSLYFLLNGVVTKFKYIKVGVSAILIYVGVKMLASFFYKIPTEVSLLVIITCLGGAIFASVISNKAKKSK